MPHLAITLLRRSPAAAAGVPTTDLSCPVCQSRRAAARYRRLQQELRGGARPEAAALSGVPVALSPVRCVADSVSRPSSTQLELRRVRAADLQRRLRRRRSLTIGASGRSPTPGLVDQLFGEAAGRAPRLRRRPRASCARCAARQGLGSAHLRPVLSIARRGSRTSGRFDLVTAFEALEHVSRTSTLAVRGPAGAGPERRRA